MWLVASIMLPNLLLARVFVQGACPIGTLLYVRCRSALQASQSMFVGQYARLFRAQIYPETPIRRPIMAREGVAKACR